MSKKRPTNYERFHFKDIREVLKCLELGEVVVSPAKVSTQQILGTQIFMMDEVEFISEEKTIPKNMNVCSQTMISQPLNEIEILHDNENDTQTLNRTLDSSRSQEIIDLDKDTVDFLTIDNICDNETDTQTLNPTLDSSRSQEIIDLDEDKMDFLAIDNVADDENDTQILNRAFDSSRSQEITDLDEDRTMDFLSIDNVADALYKITLAALGDLF